jgi:SIR2-like protein
MPGELNWPTLLNRIEEGTCTPFLGAGACHGTLPLGGELAEELARAYDYPLENRDDLARVAQYVAITKEDAVEPKECIARRLRGIAPPDFNEPDEPHGVLADLPLPVYLTTNYDDFMVRALRSRHRDARQKLCRWNGVIPAQLCLPEPGSDYQPTPANPVVFHLHGHLGCTQSLVLSEDDYLEFLVKMSKDGDLLPPRIQESLTSASILFLGYRIADWDFRVLFHNLVGYLEKSLRRVHVSVQLEPGAGAVSKEQQEKIKSYLNSYFRNLKIQVYWGTCRQFVAELKTRWEAHRGGA